MPWSVYFAPRARPGSGANHPRPCSPWPYLPPISRVCFGSPARRSGPLFISIGRGSHTIISTSSTHSRPSNVLSFIICSSLPPPQLDLEVDIARVSPALFTPLYPALLSSTSLRALGPVESRLSGAAAGYMQYEPPSLRSSGMPPANWIGLGFTTVSPQGLNTKCRSW